MTTLYRVFRRHEHAAQFLGGEIRLGHLGYYRELEDAARGDRAEGAAHHQEYRSDRMAVRIADCHGSEVASPGLVSVRTECGNDVWICSFTLPPDEMAWERVRKELGDVIVEVSNAERLRDEMHAALDARDVWQKAAPLALWPVEYTKGTELPRVSDNDRRATAVRRAVTQKPPEYCWQHEHRLALISYGTWQVDGPPPRFLSIRLPGPLEYARIVSVRLAEAP
jgi:hypothetical protein